MFPFPQSQSLMQAYFAEREEERRELRRLVEAAGGQNAAKEARAQLQAMKKSIGESLAARKRGGGQKFDRKSKNGTRCVSVDANCALQQSQ